MENQWHICWLEETDSTNDEAERQISTIDNLSVIAAMRQTAGRGQGDHKWSSADGENLTFTAVVRYGQGPVAAMAASDQLLVSQIVALSVCDYMSAKGLSARIKWPNDVYVGRMKICGILIKHNVRSGELLSTIAGIGINVNQKNFPADLPNPTSVAIETGCSPLDVREELKVFLGCLDRNIAKLGSSAGRASVDSRFNSLLIPKEQLESWGIIR